jgi:hypothetical protein
MLDCGQVLAASSTLMYPPNFVTAFFVLLVFGLVMFVFGRRAVREAGRKTAPRS